MPQTPWPRSSGANGTNDCSWKKSASDAGTEEFAIEELLPEIEDIEALASRPRRLFQPLQIQSKKIRIQPILTPDNYAPEVLKLIQSAKSSLYMQTQYIHPSEKDGDQDFMGLIDAVKQKIADGLDVRLITSQFQAQGDWEAARYYEQIFVQDWTTLARQSLPTPVSAGRAASAGRQP